MNPLNTPLLVLGKTEPTVSIKWYTTPTPDVGWSQPGALVDDETDLPGHWSVSWCHDRHHVKSSQVSSHGRPVHGAAGAAGMAGRSRIRGNEKKALAELCGTIIFDRLVVM